MDPPAFDRQQKLDRQQKFLDLCILDYLERKNMTETYKAFVAETGTSTKKVEMDTEVGLLCEWWSFFYDMFESRNRMRQIENEAINELGRCDSSQDSFQIGTNQTNLAGNPLIGGQFLLNQSPSSSGSLQNEQLVSFHPTLDDSSHSHLSSVRSNHRDVLRQAHVMTSRREETTDYTTLGNSCIMNPVQEAGLNYFSGPVLANSWPVSGVNQTRAIKGCQEPSSHLTTPFLSDHNRLPSGGCADMNLHSIALLRGGSSGMGSQQAHSNESSDDENNTKRFGW